VCVDHVDEAIITLKSLHGGKESVNTYPRYFRQVIQSVGGMDKEQKTSAK